MKSRHFNFALIVLVSLPFTTGCSTTPNDQNTQTDTPYSDLLVYQRDWPELTLEGLREHRNEQDNAKHVANRVTEQALSKIVSLNNDNLKLNQVIAFIRDTTGVNMAVNWPALELVGIDQDSLVTISLTRIPADQLMRLVLDQVSADAFDDDKAGFRIDHGIVKISTLRDLRADTDTRVYDIRWLFQMQRLQASLYRNHQRADDLIKLLE